MKVTDISTDLETLSTNGDAAILSIGATAFNRDTGEIGPAFYIEVDVDDAIRHGHVSGSTLAWWMSQSAEAKTVFSTAPESKSLLPTAMRQLAEFVTGVGGPDVRVWGNGSSFDVSILETAFRKTQSWAPMPWEFWNIRDMRTIVDVAREVGFDTRRVPFVGVAHNAGADATHQAKVISAAWLHVTQPARGGQVPIPVIETVAS